MYATRLSAGAGPAPDCYLSGALGGCQADPLEDAAADLGDIVDPEVGHLLPDWHRGYDGRPHLTPDAADRAAAELVSRRHSREGAR